MAIFVVIVLAGFPLYLLLKPPVYETEAVVEADAHAPGYAADLAYVSKASTHG